MATRNLSEQALLERITTSPQSAQVNQSTIGLALIFILPLLAIVVFHKLIGLVLMSAGILAPALVIYWLMQVKDDVEY